MVISMFYAHSHQLWQQLPECGMGELRSELFSSRDRGYPESKTPFVEEKST